jgi:hypothetical protein
MLKQIFMQPEMTDAAILKQQKKASEGPTRTTCGRPKHKQVWWHRTHRCIDTTCSNNALLSQDLLL